MAEVADAETLGSINVRAWQHRLSSLLPADLLAGLTSDDLSLVWASSLLNPPPGPHLVLVAVFDDQVVGYAALAPAADPDTDDATAEMSALEVDPDHQRQGHGSRLLAAFVDTAVARGFTRASAWCPLGDDVRRDFLQSSGWGPDGALRELARETAEAQESPSLREARLITVIAPP